MAAPSWLTLAVLVLLGAEVARRLVVAGAGPPVRGLPAVRLADVELGCGDVVLLHRNPRVAFLVGSPWTHVGLVLRDVHDRALVADITPFKTCALTDGRSLLTRELRRGTPVGVRRLNREANGRLLFTYVRRNRRRIYTHSYVAPVVTDHAWFLSVEQRPGSLICSSFVGEALAYAGVLDPRCRCRDLLPFDFAAGDGKLVFAGGYRYGPVQRLRL